jgi:hypothetical protein
MSVEVSEIFPTCFVEKIFCHVTIRIRFIFIDVDELCIRTRRMCILCG